MVARCKLGDDAAIGRMEGHLAVESMAEQALRTVIDGGGRLVARGFDPEDTQDLKSVGLGGDEDPDANIAIPLISAGYAIKLPRSLSARA